ncbi:MAG: haloacid dehalogenase-like hydrolase [Chloroflexota bacterium]
MRLVLWDVDGTLMNSRGIIREARKRALREVYGIEGELGRVAGGGMTDPQLTLATVALHGWEENAAVELLDAFREAYVDGLHQLRGALAEDLQVLPGVTETIDRLHTLGAMQSLLTGNYQEAARLKVGAVGLDRRLQIELGAFGSDNRDRLQLVPVALERAQRLREPGLTAADIVVIGDSPRDIACARAGGARAVAVATGAHAAQELAEHRPDCLLADLSDSAAAAAAILGR